MKEGVPTTKMRRARRKRTTLFWLALGLSLWRIYGGGGGAATDNRLVARAKTEGELGLYTAWGLETGPEFPKTFRKEYTFIKIDVLRPGGEPAVNTQSSH